MENNDIARDLERLKREALENGRQIQQQFAVMAREMAILQQQCGMLHAGINRAMDVIGHDMEAVLKRLETLENKQEATKIIQ